MIHHCVILMGNVINDPQLLYWKENKMQIDYQIYYYKRGRGAKRVLSIETEKLVWAARHGPADPVRLEAFWEDYISETMHPIEKRSPLLGDLIPSTLYSTFIVKLFRLQWLRNDLIRTDLIVIWHAFRQQSSEPFSCVRAVVLLHVRTCRTGSVPYLMKTAGPITLKVGMPLETSQKGRFHASVRVALCTCACVQGPLL